MPVKKPSLRALARHLRAMFVLMPSDHSGEYVSLAVSPTGWHVRQDDDIFYFANTKYIAGREWIPGDGKKFDATAAARRLLAAVKDAEDGSV